ncbi:iron ABC transporter permease [Paenibacillus athensensis]|uniref:Iron ABC transporter n=1 Tax=Paenibacillus athensensis TaxID=1967502 RepID=A0A4Y8Q502_9BACL|nr:iron ABC transporter permease [Paenibacillus athensensis]MCD1258402.1 iron ABC transporter permease [Paenibacillus athensensis]
MTPLIRSSVFKASLLVLGVLLLLVSVCISIVYGYTQTSWSTALNALLQYDGSQAHVVIRTTRVPRALIAAAVGACLAVAGALMQSLTKNKLASPGLFGINAGAAFCLVLVVVLLPAATVQQSAGIAFAGAALSALFIYALGSLGREGMTPIKLTLAGTAITALFVSLTQGMLVLNQRALGEVMFWLAGSVAGRKLDLLQGMLPYLGAGLLLAALLAGPLNTLMMGDDVARGLGQRIALVKLGAVLATILLAGGAVAVAGPVQFVGLVVPNLARLLVGTDHRWTLPFSALLGAVLLILADVACRFIAFPEEVPVGAMTALIGVPFLIAIVRKGVVK